MTKKHPLKRKGRRRRFRTTREAQEQLQQISAAQDKGRSGTMHVVIDSVEKSKQRFLNALRTIKDVDDAIREFE